MLTAVPDFAVATGPDRSPFAGNCASKRSKAAIAVSMSFRARISFLISS